MVLLTRGGFARPGTSLAFKTGTWRVQRPLHLHSRAPCHSECPAGEDAQAYLALVEAGRLQDAWETLVRVNPLPALTGRVCHHPCESACNRGQYDEAISIHGVERFLGDEAIRRTWSYPVRQPPASGPAAAVVGAGPAGLSAAYHLLARGFRVTLFEQGAQPGGTLRAAVPSYRLPRPVLDAETERLLATGIRFQPHHRLGREMSLDELRADYEVVFLGPGTQRGREWSVDGVTPRDMHTGLDLLRDWIALGSVPYIKSAAVVGGGNTSVDLARILRRAGVSEVHVITHQTLPSAGIPPEEVMTAIPREIEQAAEEGVIFHLHRGIRRLLLRGERVVGVEMVHMKKLPDHAGGLKRVAFEGTETVLHVDEVIPAIGQQVDGWGMETILGNNPFMQVNVWGVTGAAGVFSGGDARGGGGSVSRAVGDGRRAAAAMERYLQGVADPVDEASLEGPTIPFESLNVNYYEHAPRPVEPIVPVEQRNVCDEIEGGLTENQVLAEGRRCLSCGNCLACDNCWTLCPDSAVLKTKELASDGSHYVFDYDFCKGCGLCANECPCGFIVMHDEL